MAKQLNVSLEMTANTSQAKAQLQQLQKQLSSLASTSISTSNFSLTKDLQDASIAAAQLKVQLDAATDIKTGKLDLSKFHEQLAKSNMSLKQYQTSLSALGPAGEKAFASLATAISNADARLVRTTGLVSSLWTTMKNTARWQLSSSMLHGFMGTLQSAYGYAQDLNQSLNNIRIVTGQSTDQMARFADQANKAAKNLSTTTTAYTDAALIFYQQGLGDKEVTEKTNAVVKMANVTGDAAQEVSSYMTAIWNNFNKDGSEPVEHFADVITALGAATASSSAEIAAGLEKFAAIGDQIGLSYDYATTALATVVAQTRQSEDVVGTAFKTIFARIQGLSLGETLEDGTDLNKYSQALNKVGISIKDQNGELKDMDIILDEMMDKWNTLGKDQQIALAQTVAGVRQYNQLVALMDNQDFFKQNLEVARNSDGTLQEQADIYAESWEAAQKRVKASIQAIYGALLDDNFFISLTNGFADFFDIIDKTIDSLGGLKGVLLTLGAIITQVFQKQISDSLGNLAFTMAMTTKKGRAVVEDRRNEANQALIDSTINTGTIGGAAASQSYKAQGELQNSLILNARKMNEEQQKIAQFIADQNRGLQEEVRKQGEVADEAARTATEQERSLLLHSGKDKNVASNMQKAKQANKNYGQMQSIDTALVHNFDILTNKSGPETQKKALQEMLSTIQNVKQGYNDLGITISEVVGDKGADALNRLEEELKQTSPDIEKIKNAFSQWDGAMLDSLTEAEGKTEALTQALINQKIAAEGGAVTDERRAQIEAECRQEVENLTAALQREGNETGNLAGKTGIMTTALGEAKKKFAELKAESISMSQTITQMASTIMSVGMAISSVTGLINTWKDEEADLSTKLITTMTTLGMVVPTLISVGKGFTDGAKAVTIFGVKTSLAMWQVTLIVGAVTALIAAFAIMAKKAYEASPEGVFKSAKKAADDAKSAADAVKESYDKLQRSLNDLDSGLDSIENLTEGTLEWRQAINESNAALIELLSTYGMLNKDNYTIDDNGIMKITDAARNELLNKGQRQVIDAQNAQYGAQVFANTADSRNAAANAAEQLTLWRGDSSGGYDAIGKNSQLGADVGIAIAEALNSGALTDLTDKTGIAEALSTVSSLYGEEATLLAGQIASNADLQAEMAELAGVVAANTDANDVLTGQIINNEFGNKITNSGLDKAGQQAVTSLMGDELEKKAQELYENEFKDMGGFGGKTDADIQKAYAEAMGYATDTIENKNGNKAKYYNKDGSEVGVISDEVARKFLAQQEALKQLGEETSQYIQNVSDMITSGNKISEGVGDALSTFVGGNGGSFGDLNAGALQDVKDSITAIEDGIFHIGEIEVNDEYAKSLGYDSVQAYYNAIQKAISASEEAFDPSQLAKSLKMSKTPAAAIEALFNSDKFDLNKLSADEAKKLGEAYQNIFDNGGSQALEAFDSFIQDFKGDQAQLASIISQVDWSDWDADEAFSQLLENAGIELTAEEMQRFCEEMREANGAVKEFSLEQFREEFAATIAAAKKAADGTALTQKEFESLGDGYDEYFMTMSDGTHKLIGDAEDFYAAVMQNSREDIFEKIQEAQNTNAQLRSQQQAAQNAMGNFGVADLSTTSNTYHADTDTNTYSGSQAQAQINLIEQMGAANEDQIAEWRTDLLDGQTTVETLQQIADAAAKAGIEYEGLAKEIEYNEAVLQESREALASTAQNFDELDQMLRDGTIDAVSYSKAFEVLNQEATLDGLDSKEVSQYAKYLEELNDDLKEHEGASTKVAASIKRMNRGVDTLSKSWKGWQDILENSSEASEEFYEALTGAKEAISDITGVSEDYISKDFIVQHFDEIAKAAEGDAEAIDALNAALAEEVIKKILIDNESFIADSQAVMDQWAFVKENMPDLEVGASVDDGPFLDALNEMIAAAGMTAPQVNELLAGMGMTANFASEPQQVMVKEPDKVTTHHQIANYTTTDMGDGRFAPEWDDITTTTVEPGATHTGEVDAYSLETSEPGTSVTPKINSVTKTATGKSNNSSSTNSGGKNSSKGGGGGGGKKATTQHTKKTDVVDRYKEITDTIEDLGKAYKKASTEESRLFGNDRLKALDKENSLIQEQIDAWKEKEKQAQEFYDIDQKALSDYAQQLGYTVKYDDDGDITNYTSMLSDLYDQYSKLEDTFNSYTDAQADAQASFKEEQLDPLKDKIDKLKELISTYEGTKDVLEDAKEQEEELFRQWQDNNYQKITYELELKVQVRENALAEIDLAIAILGDNVYRAAEGFAELHKKLGPEQKALEDLTTASQQLEDAYAKGEISQEAYAEGLQKIHDDAISAAEALLNLDEVMTEYYGNTIDKVVDEIDRYASHLDHLTSVLEHYQSILELTGQQLDYDKMGAVYDGLAKTAENNLKVSTAAFNAFKTEMATEEQRLMSATGKTVEEILSYTGDDSTLQEWKERWMKLQETADQYEEDMLSDAEAFAEAINNVLTNKLAKAAAEMEKSLTGKFGTWDALNDSMNRVQTNADEYLTKTNQIYEMNKLLRKVSQDMDKTDNVAAKNKYSAFSKEIEQLKEKDQLSNLELEIAEAKYKQLQAQIALEEAQNAKSTVRLSRDSEGNYGYVYTADQDKVSDAEQALEDATNDLYNIELEAANDYSQKAIQAQQELAEKLAEIDKNRQEGMYASEEEYQAARARVIEEYTTLITTYSNLYGIATTDDARVVEDAWSTAYSNIVDQGDLWRGAITDYVSEVDDAWATWKTDMDTVTNIVGTDLKTLKGNVKDVTDESDKLAALTKSKVIPALSDELKEVGNVTAAYLKERDAIRAVIEELQRLAAMKGQQIEDLSGQTSGNNKNKGFVEGIDYSAMMAKYLDDGGDINSAEYLEMERQRNAKIDYLIATDPEGKGDKSYWGHQGAEASAAMKSAYEENNDWFQDAAGKYDSKAYDENWKKIQGASADSGGYTGVWGPGGKLAMLHEKELVLKPLDTENLLSSMQLLKDISSMIDLNAAYGLGGLSASGVGGFNNVIEQQVTITAEFPNATDHNEIEEAFNSLINKATQYANRF